MLKLLRHKRVAKLVLWGILILILPAFVIWGAGSVGRSKEKGPAFVGLIHNKKISFDAFAESITDMRVQIMLNFYSQQQILENLLKNKELLGKMAWDRLIMAAEAKKGRFKATNAEVVNYVRSLPLFMQNGRFNDRMYEYFIRNTLGIYPRSFEEMMRENIVIQKLEASLTKDIKVSDEEVLSQYKIDCQKFKVSYTILPTDSEKSYKEILDTIAKEKISFEEAVVKAGLKTQESALFSKSDYIEGIGEAAQLADAAAKLKAGELSEPIHTKGGEIVFKLLEAQSFNEEKFKKEKDEYAKKVLADKKNKFLEGWLRNLESKSVLNIDLKDYEKYYK